LEKALSLDQSMADAYWQRGLLLARQGAVKDAIQDLKKALELRPTRYEAHAALADAYYDLGREAQALSHWQTAISNIPDRPEWRFRYGKLLAANRQIEQAKLNLREAIKIAEQREESPRWLPQAHLLLAQTIGPRKESIEHWEAFLSGAQRESPYRAEAIKALRALGRPWTGD
jgi:Tfp pilus assembly protein PilF